MLSGITFGQFVPGESLLHKLDPRAKVAGVLAGAMSVLVAAGWPGFVLNAGFTLAAMILSRLPANIFFKGLRSLWLLLGLTSMIQLLLTPGEPILQLGIIKISREGLVAGSEIFIRLALLILLASLLTLTTSPIALTAGLESILSPLKRLGVPAHELAMMMTIALRFVPTLLQEAEIVLKAQRSRGAGSAGYGPVNWARSLLPLFVPLFAGALRRAEDLATAMEARCYSGGANRTRMNRMAFSSRDYVVVAVTLSVLASQIILRQ